MTSTVNSQERVVVSAVVRLLLEGTELIAFQYDSGFTAHFQHDLPLKNPAFPAQVSLVLRGPWSPDETEVVPPELIPDPEKTTCKPDQPFKAFKLMSFVGRKVEHAEVGLDSSLLLSLSGGATIAIAGREDEWDYSWYLYVRSDFPGADSWAITCHSNGDLEGAWPSNAPIPSAIP